MSSQVVISARIATSLECQRRLPSQESGSFGPAPPHTAPAKASKPQNVVGPSDRLLAPNTVPLMRRKLGEPEGLDPLGVGLGEVFHRRPAQMRRFPGAAWEVGRRRAGQKGIPLPRHVPRTRLGGRTDGYVQDTGVRRATVFPIHRVDGFDLSAGGTESHRGPHLPSQCQIT